MVRINQCTTSPFGTLILLAMTTSIVHVYEVIYWSQIWDLNIRHSFGYSQIYVGETQHYLGFKLVSVEGGVMQCSLFGYRYILKKKN